MAKRVDASTLAGALSCAAKVKRGQTCTAKEMKDAIITLQASYNAVKTSLRRTNEQLDQAQGMIERLISRLGA